MYPFPLKKSKTLYVLRFVKTYILFRSRSFDGSFTETYRLRFGPWVTMRIGWDFSLVTTISQYTKNLEICAPNTSERETVCKLTSSCQDSQYGLTSTASSLTWTLMLTPSCCKPGQVLSAPLLYSFLPSLVFRLFCIVLKRLLVEGL